MSQNFLLPIYTKNPNGILIRSVVNMAKSDHISHHNIGPVTSTETLVGWPESLVEWHGNVGYGVK